MNSPAGELLAGSPLADVDRVLDQHAELGAPVTQMRGADDGVTQVLKDSYHGIADGGRAQVTCVQLLGHVRPGVVDDHAPGRLRPGDSQSRVAQLASGLIADPVVAQRQVDETRTADLGPLAHDRVTEMTGQPLGHLAGRQVQALAQRQRDVGLEVGE